ncbi:MAG: 2-C-methyl-D-erythritol 4-phosphate cytidylyltransferase [Desulfobulbaceae bacterium]|nr:2-C-methyl-D-erythritol 4-phosphate cytidylyltransferase [Desulfobulbaceae bacterium]
MTTAAAIIPAGGAGLRMGLDLPKQYLQLANLPILVHTVRALQRSSFIKTIIIVAPAEHLEQTRALVREFDLTLVDQVVSGGRTRQESVWAGLQSVPEGIDLVVVHDGVRPLVDPELVDACVLRAAATGAAMLAIPVKDTLKSVTDDVVGATVDRQGLWQAQTPQVARLALLKEAFAAAAQDGFEGTDEASLLEHIGAEVSVVMGSAINLKVTRVDDLALAAALLGRNREGDGSVTTLRVGHGYDAHRLVAGRPLVLGGVTIPCEQGLLGHSDADVLLHALADAMLGAAGMGDIGRHFPDTDPAYKGISSLVLLGQVVDKIARQGFGLANADVTVIAQQPKLAPYFSEMLANISQTLGVAPACLNLKATTTEHMGFTGRGEGIAAHAVVSLSKID